MCVSVRVGPYDFAAAATVAAVYLNLNRKIINFFLFGLIVACT